MTLLKKNTKKIQLPEAPSSIITDKVRHQIHLLQEPQDLTALWNIRYFIQYGPQGTCSNETLHSTLSAIKIAKSTKMTFETLQRVTGIALMNYNNRYQYQS